MGVQDVRVTESGVGRARSRDASRSYAAIDVGTVSTRLIVASERADGSFAPIVREARITNLGQGVDATGKLDEGAMRRTLAVICEYGRIVSGLQAQAHAHIAGHGESDADERCSASSPAGFAGRVFPPIRSVTLTLTSAARDASNSETFLGWLRGIGLEPQVIDGKIEARLALLGVATDFPGKRLLVGDVGGGSTELVIGGRLASGALDVVSDVSLNIGCRRVTERFLQPRPAAVVEEGAELAGGRCPEGDAAPGGGLPTTSQILEARAFARETFQGFFDSVRPTQASASSRDEGRPDPRAIDAAPHELVCVGGTATSLVAVAARLVPYDPAFVHLHRMGRDDVHRISERLCGMSLAQRQALPGLQPARADVIAAGAIIIDELMDVAGFDSYLASESDSLIGLVACARARVLGLPGPLEGMWEASCPEPSAFCEACDRR